MAGFALTGAISWATSDVEKGKEAFEENGCTGCHKIGKDWNGPDLRGVTTYRSKEWIIDFILHTKKHYDDPMVRSMINRFNLYMPDQGVEPKDANLIYEYLKSLAADTGKQKKKK
jgi:nitrous-oxide reductase